MCNPANKVNIAINGNTNTVLNTHNPRVTKTTMVGNIYNNVNRVNGNNIGNQAMNMNSGYAVNIAPINHHSYVPIHGNNNANGHFYNNRNIMNNRIAGHTGNIPNIHNNGIAGNNMMNPNTYNYNNGSLNQNGFRNNKLFFEQ